MYANVNECRRIKNFYFDSTKSDTWTKFLVVATVSHIGMQIFKPHISKTHLSIHLMYVNSNWIDTEKTSQAKWEPPMRGRGEGGMKTQHPPPPPAKSKDLLLEGLGVSFRKTCSEHYPVENLLALASAMTKSPIDVISGIPQNFKSKQGLRL